MGSNGHQFWPEFTVINHKKSSLHTLMSLPFSIRGKRLPSGYLTVCHGKWPIEIDGLPSYKMVIFHGELLNNYIY